jgi:methionine-rich copper-binding protein CopC
MKSFIVMLSMSLALAAGPCFAHAKLVSSVPAGNSQLAAAPKSLTLGFNESATLTVLKLVSAGKEIPIPLDPGAKPGREFTLSLPPLAPGSYAVQWTALAADDGHVTKGSFTFTITG